jgi:rod shape-determining protein MreD
VKSALVLLLAGAVATMAQGVLATLLGPRACPDLGLLFVIAIGLCWRSAGGGLVLAGALGALADLLSGSLLGQHTLLRLFAYAASRVLSRRLNLRGALPQALFVMGLTAANAVALGALTAFFWPGSPGGPALAADLVVHALANGVCAPFVTGATDRLLARAGDEEAGRRTLRLEPRGFAP